jgi:hypothetical protein
MTTAMIPAALIAPALAVLNLTLFHSRGRGSRAAHDAGSVSREPDAENAVSIHADRIPPPKHVWERSHKRVAENLHRVQ